VAPPLAKAFGTFRQPRLSPFCPNIANPEAQSCVAALSVPLCFQLLHDSWRSYSELWLQQWRVFSINLVSYFKSLILIIYWFFLSGRSDSKVLIVRAASLPQGRPFEQQPQSPAGRFEQGPQGRAFGQQPQTEGRLQGQPLSSSSAFANGSQRFEAEQQNFGGVQQVFSFLTSHFA